MPNTITTNKGRSMEEITASVRIHMRNMVNNALELGTDLTEAKEACAHGQWLPWLKSVGISSSTAANYMRIAREVDADSRVAQLPYTKILALIAAPPEEREELAEMAEDMSAAEIRRLTEERNKAAEAANAETERANKAEKDIEFLRGVIDQRDREIDDECRLLRNETLENVKLRDALKKEKERVDKLKAELEQEHGRLLFAENNRIEVEVEKEPADYQKMIQERQELLNAAAEAEDRAAAAEAELELYKAGKSPDKDSAAFIIAKATHAFLSQCELMVFEPGIKEEGNAILRCVEQMNEWCRNMTAALDADLVEAEAAVI